MFRSVFQWTITCTVLCLCSTADATEEIKSSTPEANAAQSVDPKETEKGVEDKPAKFRRGDISLRIAIWRSSSQTVAGVDRRLAFG